MSWTGALRTMCRSLATAAKADKKLFTPGPLNVKASVREAMLRDLGSRDIEFVNTVKNIREKLVTAVARVDPAKYSAVLLPGSGTYAVESTIQTTVPRNGKLLAIANGAYGHRIVSMAKYLGIPTITIECSETEYPSLEAVETALRSDPAITNVVVVHCETSSGILNPVSAIGSLITKINPNITYIVDAMSSFGAVPLDLDASKIDFVISSANKCIESVPGFAYVIANQASLAKCKGVARSLSLDLYDQWNALNTTGQFRFTPPTHTLLAFNQALKEYEAEGGLDGRSARYQENRRILRAHMAKMGFKELVPEARAGYIITSYHYPKHANFSFAKFYELLNQRDMVIYPGKVTQSDCFRIGNIGQLYPQDMHNLSAAIVDVCKQMNIPLPLTN